MSARQWQPGDVAMVECSDGEWRRAMCVARSPLGGPAWAFPDAKFRLVEDGPARPLVVQDPEDGEQVAELLNAWFEGDMWSLSEVSNMQVALRSLVTPPKPEVYEHLVIRERIAGENVAVTSFCGKVWNPNDRSEVTVAGRCPECEQAAIAGWVA